MSQRAEYVNGLGVHRLGDPTGPTVIVTHGSMDRTSSFRRMVRSLRHLDVVLFDRRGYGDSVEGGTALSMAEQIADLRTVIEWADRDEVVLFGHSFGGLVSLHTVAANPDGVSSVVVWEPPLPWMEWYESDVADASMRALIEEGPETTAEVFMRAMISDRLWDRLPAATKAQRRSEGHALVGDIELGRTQEAALKFDQVTLPVVVGVGGSSDERFRTGAETLAKQLPAVRLVTVPGADHMAHITHGADLADLVLSAIRTPDAV